MNILVTSGGTRVDIDSVRHIGNMSQGTFGSKIARQLMLEAGSCLEWMSFVHARDSKTPFGMRINDIGNVVAADEIRRILDLQEMRERFHSGRYGQEEFVTFHDYHCMVQDHLYQLQFDLVILAAAVSDFLVKDSVEGKIGTKDQMRIDLCGAPKVISEVKLLNPNCKLVGFKLLVDSTDDELFDAAKRSIEINNCDLVVANDLRDIRANEHRVMLVTRDGEAVIHVSNPFDPDHLARIVARESLALLRGES